MLEEEEMVEPMSSMVAGSLAVEALEEEEMVAGLLVVEAWRRQEKGGGTGGG